MRNPNIERVTARCREDETFSHNIPECIGNFFHIFYLSLACLDCAMICAVVLWSTILLHLLKELVADMIMMFHFATQLRMLKLEGASLLGINIIFYDIKTFTIINNIGPFRSREEKFGKFSFPVSREFSLRSL